MLAIKCTATVISNQGIGKDAKLKATARSMDKHKQTVKSLALTLTSGRAHVARTCS